MVMRPTLVEVGLVLATCVGVASGARAACTGPPVLQAKLRAHPDARTYTELGTWFGDRHQYACAAEAYRSALKLQPGSAETYYLVGLSLFFAGQTEGAVGALQQSVQLAPEVLKPHLLLGAALDQLQRNQEARAQWEAALKVDPHSTMALDGLSKNLIAAGDYFSVISFLRSIALDENLTLDLAQAYNRAGMLDDAAETLTKGLRATPTSLRLNNALVTILVRQTHLAEAAKWAEKGVRLNPGDLGAQKLYLHVLVLNDDVERAQPLARKLLAAAPHDFDVLYLNGVLERQSVRYPAARTHLEAAVALDPKHYNARYNLGVVLAELNEPKAAREQLEQALALGANEPEIRFKLAAVLRTLGETQLAQEQLKLYQQEEKAQHDRTLAAIKAALALKEITAGDFQKAAGLYREAVAASPKDALLAYKLAMVLDHMGDTAGELEVLTQVVQIAPDFALAQNQLGYLLSRNGDSAAAEQHFRLAVQAAPGYTQAWVSLAATLGMQSRFPEAQEALASALRLDPENTEALQLRQELTAAQAQR